MDIRTLEAGVAFYFSKGLAASSLKSYGTASRRYLQFCDCWGVQQPLPLNEELLCQFVAALGMEGLKHSTIKCYLSGVRYLQIAKGFNDPFGGAASVHPHLDYVMRGIKRHQAEKGGKVKPRLPITPAILDRLQDRLCNRGSHDDLMIWAAACTGFFGFLRAGEFLCPSPQEYDPTVHLSLADVALDNHSNPSIVRIQIKQSKTDPFRAGVDVFLGRSDAKICPVMALSSYLARRGPQPGPLFIHSGSGTPLSRASLVAALRQAVADLGLNPNDFSGHSRRIGAATTAASRGIEDSLIQVLGRWSSSAYLQYVKIDRSQLAAVSKRLAPVR